MRWGGTMRFWRALPALVGWWAAGCEMLVPGRVGNVLCQAEGQLGPPACPMGFECLLGSCVPGTLGAPCTGDADCTAGELCLDSHLLGGGAPRCSRTCCTSSDCNPHAQFVCWIPPGGPAGFCRAAAEVDRSAVGTLPALAACTADGDCRSGRCWWGTCADTCCSDTNCTAGGGEGFCQVQPAAVLGAPGFGCVRSSSGSGGLYASCQYDSDCISGICLEFSTSYKMCSAPCCKSNDCWTFDGAPVHCVTLTGVHAGVRACGPLPEADGGEGSLEVGEPCRKPGDCRGGICQGHRCSDTCCEDASCGDAALFACRPESVDSAWALQCEPK